ncbi:DNA mismatch repair protein [Leptospira borgpetersenii serovar Hardjo-bovis]|uniref:MutS domain V protein n=1 Tax=Leptospira borgpetersenii serovar Hardjo-bovis str. Sponselee TaxID=1303729 RepID=M6BU79_LEPBO|nr:MutS family DNA mismatch repair protein [Leptospira borgpetersenii]ABJ77770.1 DNA mismatch repair protein ATPase component [Leptospira borgpetersenii serovar Hardjo-bovis str. L550]AMX56989.1 DNA mismatch repair protein [Leptospira borgpetersenii serovar Hardjo]AMX60220.1 DNA mismatch repair protein [Leptospira borgpetersenii serovar Hardjo]AMX63467.1 DNA mismatch repair protein [Leptospira borgpetersenii serovar Hardjo]AMX66706.1 DNA mismatch repair protein [Leptospira borgpetersenii serov
MKPPILIDRLSRRAGKLKRFYDRVSILLFKLSLFRLISFCAFVLWISVFYYFHSSVFYYFPSLVFLLIFFFFIGRYKKILSTREKIRLWIFVLERESARIGIKGFGKKFGTKVVLEKISPLARDLDLFRETGLFPWLDTTFTSTAERRLISLLDPEDSSTDFKRENILLRQSIVRSISEKELAIPKILRLSSYLRENRDLSLNQEKMEMKLIHNDGASELWKRYPWLKRIYRPVAILVLAFIPANVFLGAPFPASVLFLNLILFGLYRSRSLEIFRQYYSLSGSIEGLQKILIYLKGLNVRDKNGKSLLQGTSKEELKSAYEGLDRILKRVALTEAPLLHLILNSLFLYDLWILGKISKWKEKHSALLEKSIDDLTVFDSLFPFANLKWMFSDYCFPEILSENFKEGISGEDLFHPLLSFRVSNPLDQVLEGNIVLITGSNMSGKTTYLRTIAVSSILALAGGPAPASRFSLPVLKIHTSMRNEDNLEEGISFFYAEVRRLSEIVKKIQNSDLPHLVLLDEILKGTNTRERSLACKGILKELKKNRVMGLVTSHDLELAKVEDVILKHFQEEIVNGSMCFDYKIREGLVQTSNALRILVQEGLDLDFT